MLKDYLCNQVISNLDVLINVFVNNYNCKCTTWNVLKNHEDLWEYKREKECHDMSECHDMFIDKNIVVVMLVGIFTMTLTKFR